MNKIISKKKIQIEETVYLCCPQKHILFYCYYAGYVFNIKKLIFYKNFNNLDHENISIILQQNKIDEFINFKFKNKNKKIYIMLSDGYFGYLECKDKLKELKKIGYEVSIITLEEWFKYDDLNHYSFNRLIINKKNTLKKIYGVSFRTKLKYYFPLIQSIYNAIVNIKISLPFLIKPKVVYVGRASPYETYETFDVLLKMKVISKHMHKKILDDLNQNNKKGLFQLSNDNEFQNLNFIFQYFIFNVIIRFFIISHLNQFKNFYHKSNKLFNFELLKTNIYKRIFHIDLGAKPGNSFISDRTIFLERFFRKKYLRFNLFDQETNYNEGDNFKNRLIKIEKFLSILEENKNFNLSHEELKRWLIKIVNDFE